MRVVKWLLISPIAVVVLALGAYLLFLTLVNLSF